MKKLRKIIRQNVATLPAQSMLAMKVALGVRAQYMAIVSIGVIMVTQVAGVAIFAGRTRAATDVTLTTQAATNITQTTAKVTAQTSDIGDIQNGSYSFEYGKNITYGSSTIPASPKLGSVEQLTGIPSSGNRDMAADTEDNLYVYGGSTILKYSSSGSLITQWDAFSGLSTIGGITTDANDNVYVTGRQNGSIQKFTKTGTLLATWAGQGSGNGQLNSPFDLSVDSSGNIYVMDVGNNRVQKFNSSGIYQLQWPKSPPSSDYASIANDSAGNVYITDYGNNNVVKYNASGVQVLDWSVGGAMGIAVDKNDVVIVYGTNELGDIHRYTTEGVKLPDDVGIPYYYQEHMSIAIGGSGVIYVNNQGSSIRYKVSYALDPVTIGGLTCGTTYHFRAKAVIGSDTVYGGDQSFKTADCAVEVTTEAATNVSHTTATLNLSSTDLLNNRNGSYSFEYGTDTNYGFTTNDTGVQTKQFIKIPFTGAPTTIWDNGYRQGQDRHGNVYITPNGNLYKFNSDGEFIRQIGQPSGYYSPYTTMAFDSQDNVYIISDPSGYLEKYAADGTSLGTVAPEATGGRKITTDSADNLYVLTSTKLYKYDSTGALVYTFTLPSNTSIPCGGNVAVDSGGYIYVIIYDNSCNGGSTDTKMMKFDPEFNYVTEWSSFGTFNLYIDSNDLIYMGGRTVYNTSGDTITTDGPLKAASGESSGAGLLGIDVDASTAYAINYVTPGMFTFKAQARADLTGLTCNTTYHYRAKVVVDGQGTTYGEDQTFTPTCDPLQISGNTYEGQVGYSYNASFFTNAIGGPVEWSLVGGSLPPGLSFSHEEGNYFAHISGTPTQPGTYTFTLQAADNSIHDLGTDQKEFSITVTGQALEATNHTINAVVDEAIDYQVQATGGRDDYNYSFQIDPDSPNDFPSGVYMDYNGHIMGSPNYEGSSTVWVRVTSGSLSAVAIIQFEIDHAPYPSLEFTTPDLDQGRVGQSYSESLYNYVYGGFGPKTFTVSGGSLPPGLELDPITGEIAGTPTTAGSYDFDVKVSDITGDASASVTIVIRPALVNPVNTPIVTITSPASGTFISYPNDSVTITGTGPKGQTITAYMDGYKLGTATVDSTGHWQYLAQNIFPGSHTFDAKVDMTGDLSVMPFYGEGTNGVITALSLINARTMESIGLVKLPVVPPEIAYTSEINHAGTKVYAAGIAINGGNSTPKLYEVDIVTGLISRTLDLPYGNVYTGSLVISEDDSTAYITTYYQGIFAIVKVSLQSFTADPTPLAIASTGSHLSSNFFGLTMNMALANGKVYSSFSSDINDDGLQTVSIINTNTGDISSLQILDEPQWDSQCGLPRVMKSGGNVYYVINDRIVRVNPANDQITKTVTIPGLVEDQTCVIDAVVDDAAQKAYVTTQVGLFRVDLNTGVATSLPRAPRQMFFDAMVEQYVGVFQATFPDQEVTEEVLAPLYAEINQILDAFESGDNETSMIFLPVHLNLSSDGQYLSGTSLYGVGYSLSTSTLQTEKITGKTLGFTGWLSIPINKASQTRRTILPSASIQFSVGFGPTEPPIIIPPNKPPVIVPTLEPVPATKPAKPNAIRNTQPPAVAASNGLLALVRRIPEPFALGFPWLLLTLALILVGSQYYQVQSETASTKRMRDRVDHQKRLVEEQNNFVALSTHYLHTPLTVMEGEIALMVKAGTITQAQATKLRATLTSLNAEAEAVLAEEEQDV